MIQSLMMIWLGWYTMQCVFQIKAFIYLITVHQRMKIIRGRIFVVSGLWEFYIIVIKSTSTYESVRWMDKQISDNIVKSITIINWLLFFFFNFLKIYNTFFFSLPSEVNKMYHCFTLIITSLKYCWSQRVKIVIWMNTQKGHHITPLRLVLLVLLLT